MRSLYIDIDGVLNEGRGTATRADAKPFLQWALKHFICFFLTGWRERSVIRDQLLAPLSMRNDADRFGYPKWILDKTEGIEFGHPFYWVDDVLSDPDSEVLKKHGRSDCFIRANPVGSEELKTIAKILALREAKEQANAIPDLSGQPPQEDVSGPVPETKEV